MASHERNRSSLHEIQELWSLDDLMDAHLALDVHEELQRRIHAEQVLQAEAARRAAGRK